MTATLGRWLRSMSYASAIFSARKPQSTPENFMEAFYWYFGYGSNLNSGTFLDRRGIRPLDQKRMIVPGWKLNFEVAGLPYVEPGFCSIDTLTDDDLKRDIRRPTLQGIAYLVTANDYRHIIADEGGDSSYRQILLEAFDPLTNTSEQVWSLQATAPRKWCQPSLRYITLIREGAKEHGFPKDYLDYLESIEPFVLTGRRQKLRAAIFTGFWMPIILWLFAMRILLTRTDGSGPRWLTEFQNICFTTAWQIHDMVWAQRFGRGDHNISFCLSDLC